MARALRIAMFGGARARRYIPASDISAKDWAFATNWTPIPMSGPMRYGEVLQDGNGVLSGVTFEDRPTFPEETEGDEST